MARRILFVCLGNTCRSPMAEGLLRHLLLQTDQGSAFTIASAGTRVRSIGDPPDPRAQAAASTRGIDISDLRSRQATEADVAAYDLVLAMDEASRQDLLLLAPEGAQGKVRLLLDFAPGYGLKDIPDPFHGGPDDYALALDLIEGGCAGLLTSLV
ncbi:MAG: low molecular weight protein-tyrosine-phosphatase [Hyphomicrobiaceae bacterium]